MQRAITSFLFSSTLGMIAAGNALGACTDTQVTGDDLSTLLAGNTVCVGSTGNWESQEQHWVTISGPPASGDLYDYKRGPGDPKDPTRKLGTWTVNANDTVTYDYTAFQPNQTYTFTVHGPSASGDSYSFCNGGTEAAKATIKSGLVSCD